MAEFNMDEYYSKGEKLYSDMATGADVFDPKHPDISMFDKGGQYSQKYLDTARIKIDSTRGNMTPRKSHFLEQSSQLQHTLPKEERSVASLNELRYGNKPRYSKTDDGYNLVSPYSLEKEYRSGTKGMDPFDRMDFDKYFKGKVQEFSTVRPKIEDDIIDNMKATDKPIIGD